MGNARTMSISSFLIKAFNNIESYICRFLLSAFVLLLFAQILSRELFSHSIAWGEEVAVYMFVWFAFFGASYAAKMAAHNRVTVQFKLMPPKLATAIEAFADLIWIAFNCYFVYLSYDFVFNRMNLFWKSQTTGIPMKYFYMILPIAFTLMTIRIIQVNYYKLVKGIDIRDPESQEIDAMVRNEMAHQTEAEKALESESKKNP